MLGFFIVFLNLMWLLTSVLLILVILVQRGRGGGLAGAFGGMGGSSAFGTRAGDLFTRITVGVFLVWLVLAIVLIRAMEVETSFFPGADGVGKTQAGKTEEKGPAAGGIEEKGPVSQTPSKEEEKKATEDIPLPPILPEKQKDASKAATSGDNKTGETKPPQQEGIGKAEPDEKASGKASDATKTEVKKDSPTDASAKKDEAKSDAPATKDGKGSKAP